MKELLDQYDPCPLECDGLTRVIHTVLDREGIEHTCFIGQITDTSQQKSFAPHFWIELPDHTIIDYRARMWLGDRPEIPHGIFNPSDYQNMIYEGNAADLEPLSQPLFNILIGKSP